MTGTSARSVPQVAPHDLRIVVPHAMPAEMEFHLMLRLAFCSCALSLVLGGAAVAETPLQILNRSGLTLMEVYASSPEADDWGDDLLVVRVVRTGQEYAVSLPEQVGSCRYDLRLILEDGRELLDNWDACEEALYTIEERQ